MENVKVIYWSGTGNTELMANLVAKGASLNDNKVDIISVEEATKGDVIKADAVAFGCPAMGNEVLEESFMESFIDSLEGVDFSNKRIALFGSYDWGDGEWMRDWEDKMRSYGATLIDDGLIVKLTPEGEDEAKCEELGKKLA